MLFRSVGIDKMLSAINSKGFNKPAVNALAVDKFCMQSINMPKEDKVPVSCNRVRITDNPMSNFLPDVYYAELTTAGRNLRDDSI